MHFHIYLMVVFDLICVRTSAGEQEDAGQVHTRNREGETRVADSGEEADFRDQKERQARPNGSVCYAFSVFIVGLHTPLEKNGTAILRNLNSYFKEFASRFINIEHFLFPIFHYSRLFTCFWPDHVQNFSLGGS